jgi:hypothetical protein
MLRYDLNWFNSPVEMFCINFVSSSYRGRKLILIRKEIFVGCIV